jgi:hypothetical protein
LNEKLGSQSDMIAELEGKIFKQSQESKEAVSRAIEIILEADAKIAELEKELKKYKCLEGDLIYIDKKELLQRDLVQQAMGRLDGVSYALNMYCTTMSPKEFPPIGEYYAGQLQAKAPKE